MAGSFRQDHRVGGGQDEQRTQTDAAHVEIVMADWWRRPGCIEHGS
jgi:hypothetical protein